MGIKFSTENLQIFASDLQKGSSRGLLVWFRPRSEKTQYLDQDNIVYKLLCTMTSLRWLCMEILEYFLEN